MEKWYVFTAYNSQAHFGFGTKTEAEKYNNILNRNRDVNVYHYEEITNAETLESLNNGTDIDGFRLDDALATQDENDQWSAACRSNAW